MIGAASAEQEAQAVDVTVREWLLAGRQRIAVVVQDRLVARRARALLERAPGAGEGRGGLGVLDHQRRNGDRALARRRGRRLLLPRSARPDEIAVRVPRLAARGAPRRGVAARRLRAQGERGLRARQLHRARRGEARPGGAADARAHPAGRQRARARTPPHDPALARRAHGEPRRNRRCSTGLAADSAGAQLLELVGRLGDELAAGTLAVDFSEWRRWLARQLEAATFRDRAIESPVVFTSLAATRLRSFDAVLVLGAMPRTCPARTRSRMFFSQGVRAELKLPTWSERVSDMEEELAALIASCGRGRDHLAAHDRRRGQSALADLRAAVPRCTSSPTRTASRTARSRRGSRAAEVRPAGARAARWRRRGRPRPRRGSLLPRRISASAYNALVACPYQYYARYVLGLSELDEVEEEIQKRDYGSLLHDVLTTFHRAHPATSAHGARRGAARARSG